jgi:hypothetical protein
VCVGIGREGGATRVCEQWGGSGDREQGRRPRACAVPSPPAKVGLYMISVSGECVSIACMSLAEGARGSHPALPLSRWKIQPTTVP